MLQPDLKECKGCESLQELLEQIDCTLTIYGKNQMHNIQYNLTLYYPKDKIADLLHYKRILTKKVFNNNYACGFSITEIISRVKLIGLVDVKDCCSLV